MAKNKKSGLWSAIVEGVKKGVSDAIAEIAEKVDVEALERQMMAEDRAALAKTMRGGSDNVVEAPIAAQPDVGCEAENVKACETQDVSVAKTEKKGGITFEIKIDQVVRSLATIAQTTGQTLLKYAENSKDSLEERVREFRNQHNNEKDFEIRDGCVVRYLAKDQSFAFVPDGIREIGKSAFEGNGTIVSVWMPDSVEKIDKKAFRGCRSLRTVIFSKGLVRIGELCFENCVMLREIELPLSLRNIGASCFEGCTGLVRVELPQGLKMIGNRLFYGCTSLESVGWPWDPHRVGNRIFMDCATSESPYDRFEKVDTRYVRHRYDASWLEETGAVGLESESPLAQWYIDRVIQDIYGYALTESALTKSCWQMFCGIMEFVDIMTGGDPYAIVAICIQQRGVVGEHFAESFDLENGEFRSLMCDLICDAILLIGGNGNHYRHFDESYQKQVHTLCDGHLEDVLNAFSVDPRDVADSDAASDAQDNVVELAIRVPVDTFGGADSGKKDAGESEDTGDDASVESEPNTGTKKQRGSHRFQFHPVNPEMPRLSEKQQDDIMLWLRFLGALGVMPVTARYNPRVFHYVATYNRNMNYWTFVDLIEGLVRGYGIESRRFSAEAFEEAPLEDWCAAWSRALFEENIVILQIELGFQIEFGSDGESSDERYVSFAVFEDDGTAESVKYLFDAYKLDIECHLWRNGVDLYKFRIV